MTQKELMGKKVRPKSIRQQEREREREKEMKASKMEQREGEGRETKYIVVQLLCIEHPQHAPVENSDK